MISGLVREGAVFAVTNADASTTHGSEEQAAWQGAATDSA
jgi:hypothetical protein